MKGFYFYLVTLINLASCTTSSKGLVSEQAYKNSDIFYHYSTPYENEDITIGELKKNGSIGTGRFSDGSGSLVMLNGVAMKVDRDEAICNAEDYENLDLVDVSFFFPDQKYLISSPDLNLVSFQNYIFDKISNKKNYVAMVIKGTFDHLVCGEINSKALYNNVVDTALSNMKYSNYNSVNGSLIGFYRPQIVTKDLNNRKVIMTQIKKFDPRVKFIFISDDLKTVGKVKDFKTSKNLTIEMDQLYYTDYKTYKPEGITKKLKSKYIQ
jgi:alpha-acetolactate decarboxylase